MIIPTIIAAVLVETVFAWLGISAEAQHIAETFLVALAVVEIFVACLIKVA